MAVFPFQRCTLWRAQCRHNGVRYAYATPSVVSGGGAPTEHDAATTLPLALVRFDRVDFEDAAEKDRLDVLAAAAVDPVEVQLVGCVLGAKANKALKAKKSVRILVVDACDGLDLESVPASVEHLYVQSCRDAVRALNKPLALAQLRTLDVSGTNATTDQVKHIIDASKASLTDLLASDTRFKPAFADLQDFPLRSLHVAPGVVSEDDVTQLRNDYTGAGHIPPIVYPYHERKRDGGEGAPHVGGGMFAMLAGFAWNNPLNVCDNDDAYATTAELGRFAESQLLLASNFGFSIPSGATIIGIEVEIEAHKTGTGHLYTSEVHLTKDGGSSWSINQGDEDQEDEWYTSDVVYTYGGPNDGWSYSLTPGQVNSSSFGVLMRVENCCNSNRATPYVDYIKVTVWHTGSGSPQVRYAQFATGLAGT